MCLAANARDSLMTLVRLARAETAALTADLADIGKAMRAAETSLADAAEASACERALRRRRSLFITLDVLDRAAEETRAKLDAAVAETKKLEALLAPELARGVRGMALIERPEMTARPQAMRLAS